MSSPLPEKVGLESLEKIVHAWYSAGAASEPTSNKDAARKLDSDKTTISRNNKFLVAIGILSKEGNKKTLSSFGKEYALAIRNTNPHPATEVRGGLFQFSLTDDLVDYIKINSPSKEELEKKIIELAEQEDNNAVSPRTFLDLLYDAKIIVESEGGLSARTKSEIEENQVEEQVEHQEDNRKVSDEKEDELVESGQDQSTSESGSSENTHPRVERTVSYSVDIQLQVSPEHSEKSIKQTIGAITNSLEDDERESQSSEEDSQKGLGEFS